MRFAALVLVCASPGFASELAANVGVTEVMAPAGEKLHRGLYPYAAASLAFETEKVTLIPSLGFQFAPELGAWGLVATLVADFPVVKHLGLDVFATFVHEQHGPTLDETELFVGFGAGFTVFAGHWAFSPALAVLQGLNVRHWSLAPGLNVGCAL